MDGASAGAFATVACMCCARSLVLASSLRRHQSASVVGCGFESPELPQWISEERGIKACFAWASRREHVAPGTCLRRPPCSTEVAKFLNEASTGCRLASPSRIERMLSNSERSLLGPPLGRRRLFAHGALAAQRAGTRAIGPAFDVSTLACARRARGINVQVACAHAGASRRSDGASFCTALFGRARWVALFA